MKRIVLCADDYSQTPAISQGILALLQEKRLSAVTCMTNSTFWSEHAEWLKDFRENIDLGLHFNLTEGHPLTEAQFLPLPRLLIQAYGGKLNSEIIAAELNTQLDQFIASMGKLPDFIDGHQHVHHFPQIRKIILKIYQERLEGRGVYIRSVAYNNSLFYLLGEKYRLKKLVLELTGARRFKQELIQNHILHNTSFSGVYDFPNNINILQYQKLFISFLNNIQDQGLIMCHPGLACVYNNSDPISKSRSVEFEYFSSNSFLQDCQDNNIKISRFNLKK